MSNLQEKLKNIPMTKGDVSPQIQQNNSHKIEVISKVFLNGDISQLSPQDKVVYYNMYCEHLGLNPVTKPFDILRTGGKEKLYANSDASKQLAKINQVSVIELATDIKAEIYIVTVKVKDATGREDVSTGAVSITGLRGEALANAFMKAETKAKRRATFSICGLGVLDETEVETIPDRQIIKIDDIRQNNAPDTSAPKKIENKSNEIDALKAEIETLMKNRALPTTAIDYLDKELSKNNTAERLKKLIEHCKEYKELPNQNDDDLNAAFEEEAPQVVETKKTRVERIKKTFESDVLTTPSDKEPNFDSIIVEDENDTEMNGIFAEKDRRLPRGVL
jgi:hypothetical protein